MPKTLYEFIWKHSAREQLILLALTIASFPILYMTLELPKLIVNEAIPSEAWTGPQSERAFFGVDLTQTSYLAALCFSFLALVTAGGLLKMYLNTRKGVVAERLLRRFRYQLLSTILRFPLPFFRRTSQGELISVVTAEAEPLGGIMGDAVAQPVFQGGQMLTILIFLFVQSPWLGLASIALIPLQAYLIPLLQQRVNRLNKERVQNVRKLSERIGETVSSVEDLRAHNGVPYVLSDFSSRLGKLFEIRVKIYQTKFMMKFLNNFINQITPFFFFLFGGYLVITGDLTLGALVAALASYKDLTAPWKELLAYYNQSSDMSLRYTTIAERFQPPGLLDEALFDGAPKERPPLDGDVKLENVTVLDADGAPVLEDVSFAVPAGANVAIKARDADTRRAIAQVLSRTMLPSAGRISVGGQDLSKVHQQVVAQRIGHAGGEARLISARVSDNVVMSLFSAPDAPDLKDADMPLAARRRIAESLAAGNAPDLDAAPELDPSLAGAANICELQAWWLEIIEAMGAQEYLYTRNLDHRIDPCRHPKMAARIVALRPKIEEKLREAGVHGAVDRLDPKTFNPSLSVVENLLFAIARPGLGGATMAAELASDPDLREAMEELGVESMLFRLSETLLQIIVQTFRGVSGDHPLLKRVAGVDAAEFRRLKALRDRLRKPGEATLDEEESASLLALLFRIAPKQLNLRLPDELTRRILTARPGAGARLAEALADHFEPIEPGAYIHSMTITENAVGGRLREAGAAKLEIVRAVVASTLEDAGLKGDIALLIGDLEAGVGGANLPQAAHDRIAFARAAIKRPDILIFERALASHAPEERDSARENIRRLMPKATIFHLEEDFRRPEAFDMVLELRGGRLVGAKTGQSAAPQKTAAAATEAEKADREDIESGLDPAAIGELAAKRRALARAPLFSGLSAAQLRILAYAAHWVSAAPGERIFSAGMSADGAYLITEGAAELRWPASSGSTDLVSAVQPGRLVGDLSVISGSKRLFDMIATSEMVALKIGREELLDIVEGDAAVAASLLRQVAGYLETRGAEAHRLRQTLADAVAPEGGMRGLTALKAPSAPAAAGSDFAAAAAVEAAARQLGEVLGEPRPGARGRRRSRGVRRPRPGAEPAPKD